MNTLEKVLIGTMTAAALAGVGYAVWRSNQAVPKPLPSPAPGPVSTPTPTPNTLIDLPGGMKAKAVLQVADDAVAPLLLVFHGREGTETQLVPFVPKDLAARVFYLRGQIPGPKAKGKFSFYAPRLADPEDVLVPAMTVALDNIRASIAQLKAQYPTSKVLVLGGSQGGGLAYALAARGDVDGAVAVSGSIPPALRPTEPHKVGVIGIHGTKDVTVPAAAGKATIDAFEASGFPLVEWVPIEGGTHALGQANTDSHKALHKLAAM